MCVKPIVLRRTQIGNGANTFTQPVPCGKCPECKKTKISHWAYRLEEELKRSYFPKFVTLTYSDENLQYGADSPTLVKRDIQLFLKRLRFEHEKNHRTTPPIKYYAVGEYGKKKGRPHYHILLLNVINADIIHDCWGLGHTLTLPLINGGIGYVLKYISKSSGKKEKGRQSEFSLCSKGIGDNYLTPQMLRYHRSNVGNCYIKKDGGYKMSMPKYYKEKIYCNEYEPMRSLVTAYLQERNREHLENLLSNYRMRYPERDENFYLQKLEESKFLSKLDKRKQEVF